MPVAALSHQARCRVDSREGVVFERGGFTAAYEAAVDAARLPVDPVAGEQG